jgi:hypothetical protein
MQPEPDPIMRIKIIVRNADMENLAVLELWQKYHVAMCILSSASRNEVDHPREHPICAVGSLPLPVNSHELAMTSVLFSLAVAKAGAGRRMWQPVVT